MNNNQIKVLMIEDNPIDQALVEKMLNSVSLFAVENKDRLSAGLQRLEEGDIDVVILDLSLPDSLARETFNKVHANASKIPIVILSNLEDEEMAVEILQHGAQDYLIKGQISKNLLVRSLRYAIERKKSEEALLQNTRELKETNEQLEEMIEGSNQMAVMAEITSIELNQIFNTSADGMWVIDNDFKILRINDAFVSLLGQSRDKLVGEKCYDVFAGALCKSPDCPINSLKKGKDRFEYDIERENEDGLKTQFILTATPLRVLDGERVGIVENFKDITARKRAEEELKKANQKLTQLSISDDLTRIANRRRFEECFNNEWKRLARERNPLSLIMCDIDFFKLFNDTYGHQAGDDCLRDVAQAIDKNAKRPADLVARYGGEEFAVILPNTVAEGALHLAEVMRMEVQNLKIPHAGSKTSEYVTLSLGVSSMVPCHDTIPEIIIEEADKALYEAKKLGRNRAILKE